MNGAIVYVHGRGGSPNEADRYRQLFRHAYDVIGFDYASAYPMGSAVRVPCIFQFAPFPIQQGPSYRSEHRRLLLFGLVVRDADRKIDDHLSDRGYGEVDPCNDGAGGRDRGRTSCPKRDKNAVRRAAVMDLSHVRQGTSDHLGYSYQHSLCGERCYNQPGCHNGFCACDELRAYRHA